MHKLLPEVNGVFKEEFFFSLSLSLSLSLVLSSLQLNGEQLKN